MRPTFVLADAAPAITSACLEVQIPRHMCYFHVSQSLEKQMKNKKLASAALVECIRYLQCSISCNEFYKGLKCLIKIFLIINFLASTLLRDYQKIPIAKLLILIQNYNQNL
jgi:hypothetical protein